MERQYETLVSNYSRNDEKIYSAIEKLLVTNNLNEFWLNVDNEFHLEGADETVKFIKMTHVKGSDLIDVGVENDADGEQFEYSLGGDSLSQLDKLQLLSILETELC